MTHYSSSEGFVRASLFKPSGKWSEDFELDMTNYFNATCIHTAVKEAWAHDGYKHVAEGWRLVVLEPYNTNSHPIMITGQRTVATLYPTDTTGNKQ